MKVYCKNCKWFVTTGAEFGPDYCNAPTGKTDDDPAYGASPEHVMLCPKQEGYPNQGKGCSFYKPSLWARLFHIEK